MGCILKPRDGREVFVSLDFVEIFNPLLLYVFANHQKWNILIAREDKNNRDIQ